MEEDYPTSETIPFPFENGPYPQQAALMDTMLQSLRLVDDDQHQQVLESNSNNCNKNASYNNNNNNNINNGNGNGNGNPKNKNDGNDVNDVNNENLKWRANVMMLESPTGTGKSLSLACASLAWLRYREQCDMNLMQQHHQQQQQQDLQQQNLPQQTSKEDKKDSSKNWLEEWIPPEEIQKQKKIQIQQKECHHRATTSRKVLHDELHSIQNQLSKRYEMKRKQTQQTSNYRKLQFGTSSLNSDFNSSADKGQMIKLQRSIREEIAKESIEDAIMIEKRYSKLQHRRNGQYHNRRKKTCNHDVNNNVENNKDRNGTKIGTKFRTKIDNDNDAKIGKTKELDFCIDEYESDNDENVNGNGNNNDNTIIQKKKKYTSIFGYSSASDEDDKDEKKNDSCTHGNNCKKNSRSGGNRNSGSVSGSLSGGIHDRKSAQQILDGGQLDGSGLTREMYNRRHTSKNDNGANAGTGSTLKKSQNGTMINNTTTPITSSSSSSSSSTNTFNSMPSIGSCEPGTGVRKIIYAARTHSQLSQFVNEVRRTAWGNDIRIVALGGRKLLCGNKDVTGGTLARKSRSETMITEKCLDLQKGLVLKEVESKSNISLSEGTDNGHIDNDSSSVDKKRKVDKLKKTSSKTKNSCPLMSSKEAISTLALHMLAKPSDIEDLVGLGTKSQTCAYYASRESLKAAEVVVVPYNTLLSKPARKAVGLSLKSSLVIIDEAHNIPETLRSLSSCQLTLPIIEGASAQLNAYVKRYNSRLAGRNIFYLGKICKILKSLSKYLKSNKSSTSRRSKVPPSSEMVTSTELLFTLKLDNINLFNVMRYLERSRLSQKLHGFSNAIQDDGIVGRKEDNFDDPNFVSKHISCMSIIESFLKCLTGAEREGRVVVERPNLDAIRGGNEMRRLTPKKPSFRYLLLDPSIHFKDVIDEAHAIVLAGGTLRPFPHVATELCRDDSKLVEKAMTSETNSKSNSSSRSHLFVSRSLTTFSCGHVVPSRNVFVSCLSNGPSNVEMDFRHSSRSIEKVCDELGKSILSISCVVPAGFVIFFPSYTYEAHVVQEWKRSGLYNKIHHKKKVYREPKSAGDVEKTLGMYSKSATSSGAILLCVINGKMSEGINFADDMARCVLVVGLPYPDITDPELKEKMQLLDKESREKKISISGQAYYQNLCMRAVNQSIGRAIRHINDHAAIILADARYVSDSRIWNKLPSWLCGEERPQRLPFEENMIALKSFFNNVSVKD